MIDTMKERTTLDIRPSQHLFGATEQVTYVFLNDGNTFTCAGHIMVDEKTFPYSFKMLENIGGAFAHLSERHYAKGRLSEYNGYFGQLTQEEEEE